MMQSFHFTRVDDASPAVSAHLATLPEGRERQSPRSTQYLAGGTTLLDLMKLDVMQPARIIDINKLSQTAAGRIDGSADEIRLGALTRMADAANHPDIRRDFPMIAQTLDLAASPQLRNMATLGGNVLQRTRCTYFRDISYDNCNKRVRGSGCAAREGVNRSHAVLGVSDQCIATYPGDFAQALIALDADVEILGRNGRRTLAFSALHQLPAETPDVETSLAPEDLILAFRIRRTPTARRSLFLKVRDRQSYEFALASAAVALELDQDRVRHVRIALGGIATIPWRARAAEAALEGARLSDDVLRAAADAAFQPAISRSGNAFKLELGKRTMIRALREVVAMEI